ncbi:MAG: hypothetical protein HKP57_05525, partial [Halobacteria archaeon]|nr:hypothetical protein [Halobacteria archaeon]
PIDDLREQLNAEQRMTLGELELLGWTLKFVRRPLFQDPVPVVVSDDKEEIGLLDADGKIVIDKTDNYREQRGDADMGAAVEVVDITVEEVELATEPDWMEKRTGESPVPDNLEDFLNQAQINALRQIENFGWELKFVRRPLFQEPIAVIINTDGDRVGTLEADGRIDLQQNFELRQGTMNPDDDNTTRPAEKKKQTN